ncbi:MAG: MBL fold metallo-hydrolase [Alphaproteobacteria bacterium 62-8]|nr:MAG: MBL fold metallo-hydrolase [Alphaproteobacteria bacterium 62-8]
MQTRVDEIAGGIYRLSVFADAVPPNGFSFNHYLVDADEPLLFHCGGRGIFPLVSQAASSILPLARLRWISFGHVESDECGSMNQWLAAAPQAQIAHGMIACMVSLNDLADRPPRPLANGEVLDLGGKRVRYIDTPHVPHAWESGLIFEETTKTLFTGDLFTQLGDGPAIGSESIAEAAIAAEEGFHATALTPSTAPTIRGLKTLAPQRLAVMHGRCFEGGHAGDCAGQLEALAAYCEGKLKESVQP